MKRRKERWGSVRCDEKGGMRGIREMKEKSKRKEEKKGIKE